MAGVHDTRTDVPPIDAAAAPPKIVEDIPVAVKTPRIHTPPPRTPTPPTRDSPPLDWYSTPPPEPAPAPQEPKPLDIVTAVCEVIPDVSPAYVRDLAGRFSVLQTDDAGLIGAILHNLFEDPTYPKDVKGKGKEKQVINLTSDGVNAGVQGGQGEQVDYGSKNRVNRGGPGYGGLALVNPNFHWLSAQSEWRVNIDCFQEQLYIDFPEIPEDHVAVTFTVLNMLYAPTFLFLREEQKSANPPYVKQDADAKQRRLSAKKKGKRKAAGSDEEFAKERQWLLAKLQREAVEKGGKTAAAAVVADTSGGEAEAEEEEGGIECGCCFTEYPFVRSVFFLPPPFLC